MKKIYTLSIIFGIIGLLSACSRQQNVPKFAELFQKKYKNKLYAKFDSTAYDSVFKSIYPELLKKSDFKKDIEKFYKEVKFEPILIQKWVLNSKMQELLDSIHTINAHGFSPKSFFEKELTNEFQKINANNFTGIDDLYYSLIQLELHLAIATLNYYNFMKYGCVQPNKVMSRYRISIEKSTQKSNFKVLSSDNLHQVLVDAQPRNSVYWMLQRAYLKQKSKGNDSLAHKLLVNMERLRWKIPKLNEERVEVNIPAFTLKWIKDNLVLTEMNVCVGQKIDPDFDVKMKKYLETKDINLKPSNHETSILMSWIKTVQVNPVWNIPPSIAKREIYNHASRDRYYLANSGIKVYKAGRLISTPDTIRWSNYAQDKLPFSFKQAPGSSNALGKFKFIFANNDGLYLHDTNVKSAFNKSNRAVSHGCVRVQDPLRFAELLSGIPQMYDRLRVAVNLKPIDTTVNALKMYEKHQKARADTLKKFVLAPTTYKAGNPVQLYINYQTVFIKNNEIKYVADVYGLDSKIWSVLKRY